jgi:GH24 family phage-related lysozyme (muramidase)
MTVIRFGYPVGVENLADSGLLRMIRVNRYLLDFSRMQMWEKWS